jgi:uncharacterized protein YkvS
MWTETKKLLVGVVYELVIYGDANKCEHPKHRQVKITEKTDSTVTYEVRRVLHETHEIVGKQITIPIDISKHKWQRLCTSKIWTGDKVILTKVHHSNNIALKHYKGCTGVVVWVNQFKVCVDFSGNNKNAYDKTVTQSWGVNHKYLTKLETIHE